MIPPTAHFVWFGRELPWIHGFSLLSAARRGQLARVVLHAADDLDDSPGWRLVEGEPAIERRRLDPFAILTAVPEDGPALARIYARLEQPAARANMIRAALLWTEGGIYLDTDTITVRSLAPLLTAPAFCGLEHIVLPYHVRRSHRPWPWARALALLVLRDALRRANDGHRWFSRVRSLYAIAANNAVLGSTARGRFLGALLRGMATLPDGRQRVRFALGTNLLQATLAEHDARDVVVHDPEVFYPLGPEISEHWFRHRPDPDPTQVLSQRTRVVHWYASVRTRELVPRIDAAYVRRHAGTQLLSRLARSILDETPPC